MGTIRRLGAEPDWQSDAVCAGGNVTGDAAYQHVGAQSRGLCGLYHGGQQDSVLYSVAAERRSNGDIALDLP